MKCPVCNIDLVMSERQNIEIDYCPQCRGVWLDRGELDKIIERSTEADRPPHADAAREAQEPRYDDRRYHEPRYKDDDYRGHDRYDRGNDRRYHDDYHHKGHKKRKENFLLDLLDF